MAEEYKNTVHEHETTPKVTTEESSTAPPEVQSRGMFDFLKKKEEVKPQETTTHTSEPEPFVPKHNEEEQQTEHKPTLLEKLHQKHEDEEENKPHLLEKLHRSNSSSSSSDEEGEKRKKKEKKKTNMTTEEENQGVMDKIKDKFPHSGNKPEGHDVPVVTTMPPPHSIDHHTQEEHEKKGLMDKVKEKLPGHSKKPEESRVVNTTPLVETATPISGHPEEKKGFMEKIKEHLPGHHAKTDEKTEKYSG